MKAIFLIFLLLISVLKVFGQNILFEKDITLKSIFTDERESLPIVNKVNNELALFLLDNNHINGFQFNSEYKLVGEFSIERPEYPYYDLLGYSVDDKGYHLFFSNSQKNLFYISTIDIKNKAGFGKVQVIKFVKEKYLESFSYNNKFYLLTVKKNSSIININEFIGNDSVNSRAIDLSGICFSKINNDNLYKIFKKGSSLSVQKIDNNNPNPLDLTTKTNKFYYYDNKIILTLDNLTSCTQIITINLENYVSDVKKYPHGNIWCVDNLFIKSNSYIYKKILYQIKCCRQQLYFSAYNLLKDTIIQYYNVTDTGIIKFKNTALIQEGGLTLFTQGNERELDKTKQILRKISSSDAGISVYQIHGSFVTTIGGYYEKKNYGGGGGMMMTSPGNSFSTPGGTVRIAPSYSYNPTMNGFSNYKFTRSVYFKSLFDTDSLTHKAGSVPKNAFDAINDFKDLDENTMYSETVFKVGDYYVFGYYKKNTKKYYLRKFVD